MQSALTRDTSMCKHVNSPWWEQCFQDAFRLDAHALNGITPREITPSAVRERVGLNKYLVPSVKETGYSPLTRKCEQFQVVKARPAEDRYGDERARANFVVSTRAGPVISGVARRMKPEYVEPENRECGCARNPESEEVQRSPPQEKKGTACLLRVSGLATGPKVKTTAKSLEQILENIETDIGIEGKRKIVEIISEIEQTDVAPIDDGYAKRVHLKDDSVYAFAPRRFAHGERMQMRDIVDDLLAHGIVQPSISPYCGRVITVRKKNGTIRMCVDLRPLNSRVLKQKYPFPRIEVCLSRLTGKVIFTLLDLRDGFHQIPVHRDSMKYFSFATPDGQFEYKYLPFGNSEAPAEFQKRLMQILNPLI
ncbi:uncharacterized protein LOC120359905 [Solenopsis invicta]|uniref:uncharacterized protein LOC120359905 n=1 Tax=Solenopsis invicta TaxID=13686 RepID=UPI00193E7270|nr:uncharacterized protein LOC120359905 [Solenopsis invicta]